jgi:hypothetical protein
VLIIESRKERFPNAAYSAGSADWRKKPQQAEYTSASLTTRGRAAWTYGRVEVRAKLPTVGACGRHLDAGRQHRKGRLAPLRRDRHHGETWASIPM